MYSASTRQQAPPTCSILWSCWPSRHVTIDLHSHILPGIDDRPATLEKSMELAASYEWHGFTTDKAVRPTNLMGATKRVAEKLVTCINGNRNGVQCMVVRFGNVIGSSGSVIPTFRAQIEKGGPVTVTHPEITRYFISIPEAAQLVLETGTPGTGCGLFVIGYLLLVIGVKDYGLWAKEEEGKVRRSESRPKALRLGLGGFAALTCSVELPMEQA